MKSTKTTVVRRSSYPWDTTTTTTTYAPSEEGYADGVAFGAVVTAFVAVVLFLITFGAVSAYRDAE